MCDTCPVKCTSKIKKTAQHKKKKTRPKIVLVLNQADQGNKKVAKKGKKTAKIHSFTLKTCK